jgi:hypothetical protein
MKVARLVKEFAQAHRKDTKIPANGVRRNSDAGGCSLLELRPLDDGVQVDGLAAVAKGVAPVQLDVPPSGACRCVSPLCKCVAQRVTPGLDVMQRRLQALSREDVLIYRARTTATPLPSIRYLNT